MASRLSDTEKNLIVSFVHFLRQKMSTGQVNEEQSESLEVAIQCIETAFALTDADKAFHPSKPLDQIFRDAEPMAREETKPEPSDDEKAEAEKLKNTGNELMKGEKFEEAVEKYTEAIGIHRNPVFFCNRAAAYSKLNKFDLSIQDCKTALSLDPTYGKAYGRMGLALSHQNRYQEAADAYKKAVELEPENQSFRNNLEIAEQKSRENPPQPFSNPFAGLMGGMGGGGGGGGGFDINNILNNPAIAQMAQQMMSDPGMQNMMSNLMGSMSQAQAPPPNQPGGGGGGGGGNAGGMEALIRAGQQLADQMQQQNPDLIENLRRQMGGGGENDNDRGNGGGDPSKPPGPES